jgi:predicted transcriptional regulator
MGTTKEYRGRHEIIAQILQIASDNGSSGVTKTSIMYKSFLSFKQLKEYLSLLIENGLLEVTNSPNEKSMYKITQNGIQLLHICNEMNSLIGLHNIS